MVARSTAGLERDLERLRADLERYRTATEAALDSLDAAIGQLERDRRRSLARSMRANRAQIVDRLGSDPWNR